MTQPNRPRQQFTWLRTVHTPDERTGTIALETDGTLGRWNDGDWTYLVKFPHSARPVRYAEHELTEAGR